MVVLFIYRKPNNESFFQKIESIQYQTALAISGAIHGTSQLCMYTCMYECLYVSEYICIHMYAYLLSIFML